MNSSASMVLQPGGMRMGISHNFHQLWRAQNSIQPGGICFLEQLAWTVLWTNDASLTTVRWVSDDCRFCVKLLPNRGEMGVRKSASRTLARTSSGDTFVHKKKPNDRTVYTVLGGSRNLIGFRCCHLTSHVHTAHRQKVVRLEIDT